VREEQCTAIKLTITNHFTDVFEQSEEIRSIEGPEMIIQLKADTIPYYVNGTRPIALADHTEGMQTIYGIKAADIIAPVTEATDLVAPLVVLRNSNGKLRIFIDHTKLKKRCCSSHPQVEDEVAEIDSEAVFYSSFDCQKWIFPYPPSCSEQAFNQVHDTREGGGASQFPRPTNITELRLFFGLVEQLAGFSTEFVVAKGPLCPILSTRNAYEWTEDHERSFEAAKTALLLPTVLVHFDSGRKTIIQVDASRT
jgi:hypothetical protein